MKAKGNRVCIGYTRVSSSEQHDKGLSLQAQAERIKAYCIAKDLTLLEIIEDPAYSAKDLNRPGIQKAIQMLMDGQAQGLVVVKLDRLTRKVRDLFALVDDLFERQKLDLHSVHENIDSTSAGGRLVLGVLASVAQWEREVVSERTTEVLQFKKKNGEWVGRIPYGFEMDGKKLVQDPEQLALIQRAKRMRRQGKTFREIAEQLSVSVGLVHKLVNAHERTRKARYTNGLAKNGVHKPTAL